MSFVIPQEIYQAGCRVVVKSEFLAKAFAGDRRYFSDRTLEALEQEARDKPPWTVARSPSCAAQGVPAGTPGHDGPPLRQAIDGASFITTRVQNRWPSGVPSRTPTQSQLQSVLRFEAATPEAVLAVPNCKPSLRSSRRALNSGLWSGRDFHPFTLPFVRCSQSPSLPN